MIDTYNEVEVREPPIQIAGRFLGIVVFLVGIAMLGLVFMRAYQAFNNIDLLVPTKALEQVPPPSLVAILIPLVLKIAMLLLMGYFGSLIAARGANMFFSAKREARRVYTDD